MANIPTGTTLNCYPITYWNRQTEADGEAMSTDTIMPICSAINDNIKAIETMQAATDVIDVFGSFSSFEENSGTLTAEGYLTDKDIIKVLEDETNDTQQTYYQYSTADNSWTFIGSLDPYYSKSDLNNAAGKNINITTDENDVIKINTNDNVSFTEVSATSFSGTNISGNIKTSTIDNLIISAEGGSAANSWMSTNISNYISAIGSANMKNIAGEISTGTNGSAKTATIKLSGYKTNINTSTYLSASQNDNYTSSFGLTDNAVTYITEGHDASAWINTNQDKYVKYVDTELTIGNVPTLNASTMATALGSYATASNYSFAVNFGEENSKKSVVDNKGVSIGDSNSATYNTFVIGHSNSAEGSNAGQDRFVMGIANKVGDSVSVDYILGNQNTANANNSYIVGLQNNVKSLVNKPTFVMGWGNEIDKSTNKYNFVLGGYAKVEEVSDKFFVIGNGTSNTAKHNAFELSDLKMSFIAPDIRTDVGQYGIDITFLGSVTGGEDINYGFIPYRESTLCESETIYTSSISSRQYLFWLSDDINVQGNLTITEPSSTKSTHFRFRKYEIFGNDWTLYLNIHKDYNIRMMGCPGSGTSGNPLDVTARWISGYSNSDSNPGSMTGEYSGYINQYYIIKDPEDRYKYSSFICKFLHPYSYVDVDIDAELKIVTLIKGGLGAM